MDTLDARSSPEEDDMGHTADLKESSTRFAMRIDGKIDRSHVYPLTAQQILDMLRISRSSCDLYTCHEVHMRILQALVPDESEPDPDAVQCWLDHQIVFGEPTLSLAEQMGEHLSRGVCARLQAEQWLEEEQEAQVWLEQEAQQTALSYEAWLARFILCALVCMATGLLLCLFAVQYPAPWCWIALVVSVLSSVTGLWYDDAALKQQEEQSYD